MAVASPRGSFKVLYILIPKSLDVSWPNLPSVRFEIGFVALIAGSVL